jgi:hypothetical protein
MANPQFRVVLPPKGSSFGTRLFVNDTEITNLVSVDVSNSAAVDDLVSAAITIRLVGEPVPVSVTA